METRKKRATELIEKCDVKVFSSAERTQVVQVYDRRVKIDFGESVLDDMSLYSILRSWVQDDPEKHPPDDVRARKQQRRRASISVQEEPIIIKKEISLCQPPFVVPKVGNTCLCGYLQTKYDVPGITNDALSRFFHPRERFLGGRF